MIGRLLCRLGAHRWGRWQDNGAMRMAPGLAMILEPGARLRAVFTRHFYERRCERCLQRQVKHVDDAIAIGPANRDLSAYGGGKGG